MPQVRFQVEQHDQALIVKLSGRLIGDAAPNLCQALKQYVKQGHHKLIFDLEQVTLIDSTALGVLVECHTHVQREAGCIVLAQMRPKLRQLLKWTQLDQVLPVYDTTEAALAALSRPG